MNMLRIIKINFLALAAMPILLIRILAALAKLVADALGIVFSAFRIAALFAGMVLAFISFRTSDWTLEKVEVLAAIVLISAIGAVHKAAYSDMLYTLYCRCVYTDYRLLDMAPLAKGILCFAYTLHMALCGAAGWFARHARGILAICNILVVCGYPANAVAKIYLQYGMNPLQYWQAYGSWSAAGGIIAKLAALAAFSAVLRAVRHELLYYSRESLFFPRGQTNPYAVNASWGNSAGLHFAVGKIKRNMRYRELLERHFKTYGEFLQKTRPAVEQGGNDKFKTHYEQYCKGISEMDEAIKEYGGNVLSDSFKKMIPAIKRLDAAKKRIEQQAEQIIKAAQKQESSFFKGCDTKEKLEKRYKALCKTYHPDSGIGDEDTFKRMNSEYETRKKNFA